jgi:hypothetical protein
MVRFRRVDALAIVGERLRDSRLAGVKVKVVPLERVRLPGPNTAPCLQQPETGEPREAPFRRVKEDAELLGGEGLDLFLAGLRRGDETE